MTEKKFLIPRGNACSVWPLAALVVLFVGHGLAQTAYAQRGPQQIQDLNREAMFAYTNLELEEARDKLQRALEIATRSQISGGLRARTHLNLGTVLIGGFQDNAQGLEQFVSALELDPQISVDPALATPEIQAVFQQARSRVGGGGGSSSGGGGSRPPQPPVQQGEVVGNIPHVPVAEQLVSTPVPVFIEVPDDAPVARIDLYFRRSGSSTYERSAMERVRGGFAFEIPCEAILEPKVEYYLEAFSSAGERLGNAGTADQPVVVPIVATRTQPAPSLPGGSPAEQCEEQERPPAMARTSADLGCTSDDNCQDGLFCQEGACVPEEQLEADRDPDDIGQPRFFLHLGGSYGAGYAGKGRQSDSLPPSDAMADRSAWIAAGEEGCAIDDAGGYCVRVAKPGFVSTWAVRAAVGYYVTPRIGFALTMRFQPDSGKGTFADLLLGARFQYLFSAPAIHGGHASVFLGTSYGQIQLRPPQKDGDADDDPYIVAGLNSFQGGFVLGYRVGKNFGFVITPEVHLLFPTFLVALDGTAGIEIGF